MDSNLTAGQKIKIKVSGMPFSGIFLRWEGMNKVVAKINEGLFRDEEVSGIFMGKLSNV